MNRIVGRIVFFAAILFGLIPSSAAQSASQPKTKAPWEDAAFAASPKDMVAAAAEIKPRKYAKVTVLFQERLISIDAQQRATQSLRMVYRIEDKSALQYWGTSRASWSPWLQNRPNIRARVIDADGKVSELDSKILTETPIHDQRPVIYEDERLLSGPLPNVQVGSIVEEELAWQDIAVSISQGWMRRFYVGGSAPMEHTRLVVTVPDSLPFQYRFHGGAVVDVKQTQSDGKKTFTFDKGPIDALEPRERDLPADAEMQPAVDYSTAKSWNAIAAEYFGDIESAIQPTQVSEIIDGTKGLTKEQLLRQLVTNLHRKVRYTGMEFGNSAIIPHKTAETLKTGYGDCKDKAIVLISALKAAGVDAKLALLNTRGGDDVNPELPGIGLFDHAIVYIPGTPATWIDATAEFYQPGVLPWGDQGRLALIVDRNTNELIRIPLSHPEQNAQQSTREFLLSEFGPAQITETLQGSGAEEAIFRAEYGHTESKDTRERLERYVKTAYLAEGLDDAHFGLGSDLTQPLEFKLVVKKGKRGSTDMKSAVVALPISGLMWNYPQWILQDDGTDKSEQPGWKPRKSDVEVCPFSTEWRYKITPPAGFDSPSLPKDDEVKFGTATLTRKYRVEKDGTVTGLWKFDSGKARLTPSELKAFQQALHAFSNRSFSTVTFRQKGAALLAQGKSKEALDVYRSLVQLHPHEALHHIQIAHALLEAGFGEAAKLEARRATELDTKAAEAWNALAWISQHDAIGRRFGKGFDLENSLTAYRKAIELDPKSWNYVADYAILLEHNKFGERYAAGSNLDAAATNYRLLMSLSKEKGPSYDTNLAFALFYDRKWKDTIEFCAAAPTDKTRTEISIAATAELEGAEAAIADAERAESSETDRSARLVNAASLVARMRDYKPALELLRAAEGGQEDKTQIRGRIEKLQSTRKYEDLLVPASDPRYPVQGFFLYLLDPHSAPEDIYRYTEPDPDERKTDMETSARAARMLRRYLERNNDESADEMRDDVFSDMKIAVEGNDSTGYRLRSRAMGDFLNTFYVVRSDSGYKIIGESSDVALVGREVLGHLSRRDLITAKHWLDWVREEITLRSGDDPLAGFVFPRFWTRGGDPDAKRMRLAAIALLSLSGGVREYIPELVSLRAKANGEEAERLDLLLATCASKTKNWPLLLETAQRLYAAHPDSDVALGFIQSAAIFGDNLAFGEKIVAERLAKRPDDLVALRMSAALTESKADFESARQLLRNDIIDKNRAEMNDFNQYTWLALFTGKVTDEDVSILQRATAADKNSGYAEIHTLACLYAEQGKTKDARELLLGAMDAGGLDEPDSSIWYGYGRIAEQFGLTDIAQTYYKRVEKSEGSEMPTSTFNLARKRERILVGASQQSTTPAQ